MVGNTNSADLGLAETYLLPSVASVIIGGTSIFGGRGGYEGSIIGALILTVLNGVLTLVNSPEPVKQILYGGIIFALADRIYTLDGLTPQERRKPRFSPSRTVVAELVCSRPMADKRLTDKYTICPIAVRICAEEV